MLHERHSPHARNDDSTPDAAHGTRGRFFPDHPRRHTHRTLPRAMGLHPIQDTNQHTRAYPAHTGRVHPDRVIVPVPTGAESPARPVRFARALARQNRTPYAFGAQSRDPSVERACGHTRVERAPDRVELSPRARLMPRLGDVPTDAARVVSVVRVETLLQQVIPATGRVLDLTI